MKNSKEMYNQYMHPGIIFAVFGALAFGIWTVFHQQAANYINYLFGAIIVSLAAVALGTILLVPQLKTATLYSNPKGILFAVLAGICALGIDYFALKAYGSGLQISVAGPIIIGGSIAVASTIGFFLGDSVTLLKVFGIALVIIGSAVLATSGS